VLQPLRVLVVLLPLLAVPQRELTKMVDLQQLLAVLPPGLETLVQ
jgi:hypothetical protein